MKYFILFVIFFFMSCGLHSPQSEGLVYESETERMNKFPGVRPYEVTISMRYTDFSNDFISKSNLEIVESERADYLSTIYLFYLDLFGGTISIGKNAVMGFSPGFLVFGPGADLTFKVPGSFYTTISGDMLKNSEFIIQRRVFQDNRNTFTFGLYYKNEKQLLGENDQYSLWGRKRMDFLKVQSSGVRFGYQLRKDDSRYRAFLSIGKELKYGSLTISGGLSYSLRRKDWKFRKLIKFRRNTWNHRN